MAKKKIEATLSVSSMKEASKEIREYKQELADKLKLFTQRLAEEGVKVGQQNLDQTYGQYITFEIEATDSKGKSRRVIIAKESSTIIRKWVLNDGTEKSAEVSPLLMAEFGSGWRAKNPLGIQGVGQGTFPNQQHAFDKNGWYWKVDKDQEKPFHSYGEVPTHPMYSTSLALAQMVNKIAKEVFG